MSEAIIRVALALVCVLVLLDVYSRVLRDGEFADNSTLLYALLILFLFVLNVVEIVNLVVA